MMYMYFTLVSLTNLPREQLTLSDEAQQGGKGALQNLWMNKFYFVTYFDWESSR